MRKLLLLAAALLLAGCGDTSPQGKSAPPATISVPVASQSPHNPALPIVVTVTGGTLDKVTVVNSATGKQVKGTLAADANSWSTAEPLGYKATYKVAANAQNTAGNAVTNSFTVNTLAPAATAYANVVPAPERVAATGIGVGQPMVFKFTKAVRNRAEVQKRLKVTTTPPQPGAWYWTDDFNAHYRGPQYWLPGTKIHLQADVYGVDLGNGIFGAEDNAVDYVVHDALVAKADGATKQLTVFRNGVQVKQMPMSLGSRQYPSQLGPHVVSEKLPTLMMDSCSWGLCPGQPGAYREKVDLNLRISNSGEFIHSAPWSVGQQGSSNVSHGCVNLSPANAKWMFDTFNIGDVVEITNSGGPPLKVWDTYGDWLVPWEVWQAGNA